MTSGLSLQQAARKYAPAGVKLFYNDYGAEGECAAQWLQWQGASLLLTATSFLHGRHELKERPRVQHGQKHEAAQHSD